MALDDAIVDRAIGALLGQLAGDSLGALVEFQDPEHIAQQYPNGVFDLADGGVWNTLAGQPTDDSELALALARSLVTHEAYLPGDAFKCYVAWLSSGPFDVGNTISAALRGQKNPLSQANGALMRVSPLAIFGARADTTEVADWAAQDAELTHPHPVCVDINRLYATALARAVRTGEDGEAIFEFLEHLAHTSGCQPAVLATIASARSGPPASMIHQMGWVLLAFQNALHHLRATTNVEDALIQTIAAGGDTDTNAAICGALLGGVYGMSAMPTRWADTVRACRPAYGVPGVLRPRPAEYWPNDFEALATALVTPRAS